MQGNFLRNLTIIIWVAVATLVVPGCGNRGGGGGSSGGTTGSGSTPGTPIRDQDPPLVTITSPTPASYLPPGTVDVSGNAVDLGVGIGQVLVDGLPVTVSATGDFLVTRLLTDGLNVIVVRAVDLYGNASERAIGVMAGTFVSPQTPVDTAVAARLSEPTLQTLADTMIAQFVTSAVLQNAIMAQNPIFQQVYTVFGVVVASAEVNVLGVSMGPMTMTVDATSGGLDATVVIPQLRLDVNAHSIGGLPWSATGVVTSDPVVVYAETRVSVTNGQLQATVTNAVADLQNFDFQINNFPSLFAGLFRSSVKDLLENVIEQQITQQLPVGIANALALLANTPSPTVLGVPMTIQLIAQSAAFDPDGVEIGLGLLATAPANPNARPAPGVLSTPYPPPPLSHFVGFDINLADDALNRILFALWQANAFDLVLDDQFFQQRGITLPFPFNAAFLTFFFPSLQQILPPGASYVPMRFVLRPDLPPVAEVTGSPDLLVLNLGELGMTIEIDPGTGWTPVMDIVLQVEAGATLVPQGQSLQIAVYQTPVFRVDINSAPPGLDLQVVTQFLGQVVPPLLQASVSLVPAIQIPALPTGRTLTNLLIQRGAQDFVRVQGDIQ